VQHSTEHGKTWSSGSQETGFAARQAEPSRERIALWIVSIATFMARVERKTKWRCEKQQEEKAPLALSGGLPALLLNDPEC
jgi:hypothetical protein